MEALYSAEARPAYFSDIDEITSVTARGETCRPESVIDDDVGPASQGSLLDLVPVRERQKRLRSEESRADDIEIIDVYSKSKLEENDSDVEIQRERMDWRKEVDEYDLNSRYYSTSADYNRFSDDNLQTVVRKPQTSVTLTRHECTHVAPTVENISPGILSENSFQRNGFSDSSDIGRQITQLAQRIESLGNISRVYQKEQNPNVIHQCPSSCTHEIEYRTKCYENISSDQNSLKTARKLDKVERLQKRQEAMQTRLTDLARKLNDSTKDLTKPASNNENFHSALPKSSQKSVKKASHKVSKAKKSHKSSFLNNILNDVDEVHTQEVPLLSSSYCLQNDLSSGTPESVVTDATSKYLNDELNNIRQEFRTQVEEIRRLLSERYQKTAEALPREQVPQSTHQYLADQIDKSITKVRRDTSPNLKNITNITRYEEQPCPLDKYLVRSPLDCQLPSLDSDITPSLRPGILPSVAKAIKSKQRMISDPIEAERFLVELRNRRANLENNISCLERAKDGQFLFSILEKLQGNENSFAVARIQAMVDDAIVSVNPEIQWEVKQEFQNWLDKRHQRQIQQDIEDEQQSKGKLKHPKSTKIVQHINYNQISSNVAQKPCKKYWAVQSKVDTGLKKPEPRIEIHVPPVKVSGGRAPVGHSTWSNRRRYRTPYLHFVNDIKLAKKSIGPLCDGNRNIPIIESSTKRLDNETIIYHKAARDDSLVLFGVRQYSLDYLEEEEKVEKPQLMARATSPRSESKKSSVDDLTERVENKNNKDDGDPERSLQSKIPERPQTPPSPSLSEIGTGFHLKSTQSSKPREERVGPFIAIDPLEDRKINSRPINVMLRNTERRKEPDTSDLRRMIEKALYDQIEIPSPTTSTDLTLSLPKGNIISTPLPSIRDNYSEDFGTESIKDKTNDYSMTMIDEVRTPDMSHISTDHNKYRSIETPPVSPVRSLQGSPKRQMIPEKRSEAVQTISDKGMQTIEDKQIQTNSPARTQTPKEVTERESVHSFSTTSGLEESLSDTQVESWSDGMWLMDRSEGEMAEHYVPPVSRWNLGSCPDNPLWPHGTDDLMRMDRQSIQSFGEFVKPTLPGLIPTIDGVLQLKAFPFKQKFDSVNFDDDNTIPYSDRLSKPHDFNLIRMSRDSKSKNLTARSARDSAGHSKGSDGEAELPEECDEEEYVPIKVRRDKQSKERDTKGDFSRPYNVKLSNESYNSDHSPQDRSALFQPNNFRRSNESNQTDLSGPFKESYSDRMKIDPMKYLRGSKQSQSDFSDTGGMLSTGQVIAAAFNGGDSADFDGFSDNYQDKYNPYKSPQKELASKTKQAVIIPILESVDRSDGSHSEISEILLQE